MPAELVVVKGKDRGTSLLLDKDASRTIGRAVGSDLQLKGDKKVSTAHARLTPSGPDRWLLEDLGSTNGTFVNGERVHSAPLRTGDRVKIGHTLLVFHADAAHVKLSDLDDSAEVDDDDREDRENGHDSNAATPAPVRARSGKSSAGVKSKSSGARSSAAVKSKSSAHQKSRSGGKSRLSEDDGTAAALIALAGALAGPVDLKAKLERALRVVLGTTLAARAILFLRDPDSGALGTASAQGRDGAPDNVPVDSDVLRRAVGGEVAAPSGESQAAAAPVTVQDRTLGALYIDSPGGRSPAAIEGRVLAAAASGIGLYVRQDRLERLVRSAVEIVALAQTPPARAALDLAGLVDAAARLYAPVAQARGLTCDVVALTEAVSVLGDEALLGRALDRLVEAALLSAKGGIRIAAERREGLARIEISRGGAPIAESLARELAAAEGPSAALESALARSSDGALAFVRAAVARSGGRLLVEPGPAPLAASYVMELPLA